jgi:hypothetical protein
MRRTNYQFVHFLPFKFSIILVKMITIDSLRDFWGADLESFMIPVEMEDKFPQETKLFLREFGLPKSKRMFIERENFIRSVSPFPDWKFDAETIKSSPFFEFSTSGLAMVKFGGKDFIRIGSAQEDEIIVEVNSGKVFYLIPNVPEPWPFDFPLIQKRFLNSSLEKLIMFLTAEFLFRRKLIKPGKNYVESVNTKNKLLEKKALQITKNVVDKLEKEFLALDNYALITKNNWWSTYLQDARTYLGLK